MPSSRTPAASPTSRSGTSARNQIISMLKDDHKKVRKAFRDFERLDPEQDAEQCQQLVEQVCNELTLHAMLEEELLYPAAKQALPEPDLVLEAEVEHGTAKQLIEQLKGMTPDDEKYAATFIVLGEYIKHHAKEEETEMFPQLSKAKQIDWEGLCDEMNGRRAELMDQLLPEQAAEEEAENDAAAAARSTPPARKPASRSAGSEARAQAAAGKRSRDDATDPESDRDVSGASD